MYDAEYYQANRDRIQASQDRWRAKNVERLRQYRKEYYRKNLDAVRKKSRECARLLYQSSKDPCLAWLHSFSKYKF